MSAGKGDTPRPVNPRTYAENYDRIFRKKHDETINFDTHNSKQAVRRVRNARHKNK